MLKSQLESQDAVVLESDVMADSWSIVKTRTDWFNVFIGFILVSDQVLARMIASECQRWRIPVHVSAVDELSDFDLDTQTTRIEVTPPATPEPILIQDMPIELNPAKLTLVGAGPGNPRFLTLAAMEAIQEADFVVSDRLVSPEIKSLVDPSKLRIAAKVCGKQALAQKEINDWCLEALQQGKRVVRLKGGDPFVFGRGGEELLHFRKMGYPIHVVPGISSSLAAPQSAMIPVTHRGISDQVLICTGRRENGTMPDFPSYSTRRTLVFLMAIGSSNEIVRALLEQGYPSSLPAAVVEKATCPNQRSLFGTLGTICKQLLEANVTHHATLIVGDTVNILQPNSELDECFFE